MWRLSKLRQPSSDTQQIYKETIRRWSRSKVRNQTKQTQKRLKQIINRMLSSIGQKLSKMEKIRIILQTLHRRISLSLVLHGFILTFDSRHVQRQKQNGIKLYRKHNDFRCYIRTDDILKIVRCLSAYYQNYALFVCLKRKFLSDWQDYQGS